MKQCSGQNPSVIKRGQNRLVSTKAAIGKPSVKKIDSDHLESIFKISEKPIRFYTCKRLAIACWSNLISSHLKFVYVISDKISLSFDIIVPSNSR